MEEGASSSAPIEVVLYHVGNDSLTELGVFEGWLPAATLSEDSVTLAEAEGVTLPEAEGVSVARLGLYLALLEDGEILDVAYLSPLVEEEEGEGRVEEKKEEEEEGQGKVEEKMVEEEQSLVEVEIKKVEEEEGEDSAEEKEKESWVAMAKGEEEEGGSSAEEKKEEEDEMESSVEGSVEEEEEESSEEEYSDEESPKEDGDEESSEEEDRDKSMLYLQIRIWLDSSHLSLVLFDEGCWRLTKSYSIKLLRGYAQQLILRLVDKQKSKKITSCWLKGCLSKLDFEGPLLYSNDLEEIIKKEMNPSMDCFTVNKRLGYGATSKVYECSLKKPSVIQHAVKIIKAKRSYDINAYNGKEPREIQIMSCFHDSTVVTFYQAWSASESYDEEGGCLDEEGSGSDGGSFESDDSHFDVYIHIHMEIFRRTLKDTLALGGYTIDIEEGWVLFENIAEAVSSLHQKGVIHRDLKPGNIFIGHNGKIKLGDFGDCCFVEDYMDGVDGTPDRGTGSYTAPELDDGKVSKKVDIYSLGIIFLEIFHPFATGQERQTVLDNIKKNKYPTNWAGDTDFLKKLTARSSIERASMEDIRDYIRRRR